MAGKIRRIWTHEEVSDYFTEQGCILLSKFKKQKYVLDYICSSGHKTTINFDHFKRGKRCIHCKYINQSLALRTPYEEVFNAFVENKFQLLISEEEYITSSKRMKCKCVCGNDFSINLTDLRKGVKCRECASIKRRETLYANGNCPSSSQQRYISNLLKAELNYPVHTSSLDLAFPKSKLYIEFDGSGHDLNVKLGHITNEQFIKHQVARKYALQRRGWREIRIVSKDDKLPSDLVIMGMIIFGMEYMLTGHSWIIFNIDNSTVETSQYIQDYDFDKLRTGRRIQKEMKNKEVS